MAAGLVTLNFLDGDGNTRTGRFWSLDGTVTGLILPPTVVFNSDGTTAVVDLGSLTETAPATDTASSGINGRLQRIAQRITSLLALVPASLGRLAAAASFSVAISTEDKTALDLVATDLGGVTETAPASDTASSGLNGRAQRIAQRLTSLIALIPASLGTKSAATSLAVALSTEDAAAQTTAATARGAPADVAWTTGSGSMIALLKAIAAVAIDTTANVMNLTQLGGVTVSTGNGVVGTGVQRVAIASDTTMPALAVAAYGVQTTITRPANTTAYTANDVMGGAVDLGVLGTSGNPVMITSVQLEADIAAIPSGQTSWILHLYNITPPSALADNAAFDIPSGDRASYLGQIALTTLVDQGSTLYMESNGINKQVKLSGTHLFGYLATVGAFTPAANSEVYKLSVHTVGL